LVADARNISTTMGLQPDWPNLGVISLAHSYGFSNLILPLLLEGIPLILLPSPFPEAVRRIAQTIPALTLPGVPALWRAWHEAGISLPNVKLAISAGAPLPCELEHAIFAKTGLKIHNFYGSSECGGITYDRETTPRTNDTCVGKSMDNVNLELNEAGCLVVQSGAVGQTYWPEPLPSLAGGRFVTSDLAEFKQGEVYLRGRLTDQINVAGRKVAPSTIETALRAHAKVKECLVFGVPSQDADRSDQIVACVETRQKISIESLKQFLLQHLPGWQVPRQWWFVDSLEANHRGKLSRAEWRRKFLERS
jgi:acyl-coenzyme A synthetase/AMP-(fatty) acid ligase